MTYRPIHATLTTPERGKIVMRPARAHPSDLTVAEPMPSETDAQAWIEARLEPRWRTKSAGVLAREIARERVAV